MTDPGLSAPHVTLTMRRAAELVRDHRPASMTVADAAHLVETLQAPRPERVVRPIRSAISSSPDPAEQVVAIVRVVEDLRLGPS